MKYLHGRPKAAKAPRVKKTRKPRRSHVTHVHQHVHTPQIESER